MKSSQLKQLIREEVRKALNEFDIDAKNKAYLDSLPRWQDHPDYINSLNKSKKSSSRKPATSNLDPNATYVAYIGTSRGDFDPELFKKVSGNVSTVAKAVLKKATDDVDGPEFAEEFIRGFKLDEDTYYILTGEESAAVVGKPKSKKYGEFWSMLVDEDLDGAEEIFDQMDIDSGNAPEL